MLLIKIDKLKKYYEDKLILDISNLEISSGDKIGLIGENGCGKTTLIKSILGLIPIDEGNIFLTDSYSYISQDENSIDPLSKNEFNKNINAPKKYKNYLSGGEKVKIKISNALTENKELLIADEPTSNLDRGTISSLQSTLKNYNGALLLVSHDRDFLDNLCNTIVEIENGKINVYPGNYTNYLNLKKSDVARKEKEYNSYIKEKNRLENAITVKEHLENRIQKTPKRMGNSEARLHRKMGGQKGKKKIDNSIKNIKKRLEHLDVVEKPTSSKQIKIVVQENLDLVTKTPISIKNYDLCTPSKLLIKNINFSIKKGDKVGILGNNGCGKTLLLKKIIKNTDENIKINSKVKIGYFDQTQKILDNTKSIVTNIKLNSSYDESFIRINLDRFGFKGDVVYKNVSSLSGGEKVKVALCKILLSDNNVLILDEPTNYLDIKSIESLEKALLNTNKTLILVSHDMKFVESICNHLIFIKDKKLKDFHGSYKEYIDSSAKNIDISVRKSLEEKMLLENKISKVLSLLSLEKDLSKKEILNNKYLQLIAEVKKFN
ncbi:ABC-F type ribosomal protection protein CplR [uncultured Clostridium sp.]|uniref:ABC-F type ribosomal protection protein CplR n=1 Tax=uncultured Clostridium sp. TaxID=59620 RepID=UPI0025FE0A34|nr:ABC-F type ribosomal protection protein CplR [uncultured Clostridium sp.]